MTAGRQAIGGLRDWNTPPKYVQAVEAVLGVPVSLDPCANETSYIRCTVSYSLPKDGLRESWDYPTIYVNPPYGRDPERGTTIKHWLARCAHAGACGSQVLALIPVATNTAHWKESVFAHASAVCFLADTRLRFHAGGKAISKGAPMACAMVYWGSGDLFAKVFRDYGTVMTTLTSAQSNAAD